MKKLLILSLLMVGCTSAPYAKRVGIVHDYIIKRAELSCAKNGGLHYIVEDTTILAKKSHEYDEYGHDDEDFPCTELYKFRCQNRTILYFHSGVGHCFISEDQLLKTLKDERD